MSVCAVVVLRRVQTPAAAAVASFRSFTSGPTLSGTATMGHRRSPEFTFTESHTEAEGPSRRHALWPRR